MFKRIMILALALTVLALSGCALRTVEEMYSLPKRSEQYNRLQSAIDIAMAGLEYSAPVSGEHRQALHNADLNGDGKDEYLVFAKGSDEKPLQLLIFQQLEDGSCGIMEAISFRGSAFEQVEYIEVDGAPGYEILVGRQVSDRVMGSVSVYSFSSGHAQQLLGTDYTRFLSCDMDSDGLSDVLVMRPGESGMTNGVAVLYSFGEGAMVRSLEAQLSAPAEQIKRITPGRLLGGTPAVYVASAGKGDGVVTDVFALRDDRFTNIAYDGSQGSSVETIHNYAVYADDLDGDGVLELPKLITIRPVSAWGSFREQYLLRWYAMDLYGNESDKLYTFHNFAGGWYLRLDGNWATYLTLEQREGGYTFYMWNEDFSKATILFTINEFSGLDREYRASLNNQFVLSRQEDVIYAARLESGSALYGFTEDYLISSFSLIKQER